MEELTDLLTIVEILDEEFELFNEYDGTELSKKKKKAIERYYKHAQTTGLVITDTDT